MHISDIKHAAALVHLIELLEDADCFTVRTSGGEVTIGEETSGTFSEALTRMAYAELDLLGAERPPVAPKTSKSS